MSKSINPLPLKLQFSIWWSIVWRYVIVGGGLFIIVEFIWRYFSTAIYGYVPESYPWWMIVLQTVLLIFVTMRSVSGALSRTHLGYEVAMIKKETACNDSEANEE